MIFNIPNSPHGTVVIAKWGQKFGFVPIIIIFLNRFYQDFIQFRFAQCFISIFLLQFFDNQLLQLENFGTRQYHSNRAKLIRAAHLTRAHVDRESFTRANSFRWRLTYPMSHLHTTKTHCPHTPLFPANLWPPSTQFQFRDVTAVNYTISVKIITSRILKYRSVTNSKKGKESVLY